MSTFAKKDNIPDIQALSIEEKDIIIDKINKEISDIRYLIISGENFTDSQWPSFMGLRKNMIKELGEKKKEYEFFRYETKKVFNGESIENPKTYLRAYNNFMGQKQMEILYKKEEASEK